MDVGQGRAPTRAHSSIRALTILDTSVASTNLGDQIIMQAVRDHLSAILPDAFTYSVASHEWMGAKSRGLLRQSEVAIAGGSNLLSSRMWVKAVWKLSPLDALLCNNVVLMGCGWYQFQHKPDPYTRWLLRSVLHAKHLHSVRDNYSRDMLRSIGIENVVNTGCPTLWSLTPEYCATLPKHKAEDVVTTLNTYIPDEQADGELLRVLRRNYRRVYIWVQTKTDYEYARKLDPDLLFVEPSLQAYDQLLTQQGNLDYVGNRLHGGIRAMQKGLRAVIVEIDNRAREMGKDFGLPTVERKDFAKLEAMVRGPLNIEVHPPLAEIARWKAQF
jgi:polysaccharide pyruvyl transferase WcaK-like protein